MHAVYVTSACVTSNFFAKARCNRSLRRNEESKFTFLRFIAKGDNASVLQAHCSCKGGSGGHCNHIFLCLLLTDYLALK